MVLLAGVRPSVCCSFLAQGVDMAGDWLNQAKGMYQSLQEFGRIPEKADAIASQAFGEGSPRDSGTMNAFRHALGTGMMTQAMGGGDVAAAMAKMAGYGWEGLALFDKEKRNSPAHWTDTRHDLNANAIGAKVATQTANQQELVNALKQMALRSVPVSPPAWHAPSPGYLTRTER